MLFATLQGNAYPYTVQRTPRHAPERRAAGDGVSDTGLQEALNLKVKRNTVLGTVLVLSTEYSVLSVRMVAMRTYTKIWILRDVWT